MINPNSNKNTTLMMKEKSQQLKSQKFDIEVTNLKNTPELINTREDVLMASAELEELILRKQSQYDGFIIACHSDPGLEEIRKKSEKLILGIGEASYRMACLWGKKVGILAPSESSAERKMEAVKKYGCEAILSGIEITADDTINSLLEAAKRLIAEFEIRGVILGCANYCYAEKQLEEQLGIKVFDGVASAVRLAEILLET